MGFPSQSSAAGVLALLSDPEAQLKQYALKALNQLVPQFWAEISEHIALMYVLMSSSPSTAIDASFLATVNLCMRAMSFHRRLTILPHF